MPVVYFVTAIVSLHDLRYGHGSEVPMWLVAIFGFALWLTALVLSIRAIVVSGVVGAPRAGGVIGVILSLLAVVTAAASAFFSLFFLGGGAHGRPLRVGGRPRLAPTRGDPGWSGRDPLPDVTALTPGARARCAARWTRDAREEHASIAAFARLSLDLLALGAPADLVERAQRAGLDEVRHARLSFALASAYEASPVGPAPWPEAAVSGPPEGITDTLRRVALESLVDGAYGEGLASLRARDERSDDPAVSSLLALIARDEAEHAALGWDVLSLCLERAPSLAPALLDAAVSIAARAASPIESSHAAAVASELRERLRRANAAPHGRGVGTGECPLSIASGAKTMAP